MSKNFAWSVSWQNRGLGFLTMALLRVIPLNTAQKQTYRDGDIDQVDLLSHPRRLQPKVETIRKNLQAKLGESYSVTYPAAQGQRMTQMLSNFQIGLNFLSGMALFVGAFLIYNAFAMTVAERTREFGMLRTVGMSQAQIISEALGEAALLGVFGSALGIGLGL